MDYKNKIILGKCDDFLPLLPNECADLVFADPPFNIDLKYDKYKDKIPYDAYCEWTLDWIKNCKRILKPDGSIFIAIGDEYAAEVNVALKKAGLHFRNWIVWYYTFGEAQQKKFSRCHTHILYFTKSPSDFCFNADEIRVPSARQIKYKDKRANPNGKIPDDVWEIDYIVKDLKEYLACLPQDDQQVQEALITLDAVLKDRKNHEAVPSDVWKISRVCGTFKERLEKHPCQMPEAVLERIIKAASKPGDLVVDPFCGTGTTVAVAHRLGRNFFTTDISEVYIKVARRRIADQISVDMMDSTEKK